MAYACRCFDPFVLNALPIPAIQLMVDKLTVFKMSNGVSIFNKEFLRRMKSEVKRAKEHASMPFDWDSICPLRNFKDRSHRRELKKEAARVRSDYEDAKDSEYAPYEQSEAAGDYRPPKKSDNWMDDLGEYSRRIWEWWLLRWLYNKDFIYFGIAIRKVVLWKMSSAIVERDFSQYLAITNACGSNLKFPTLQNRVYSRCNKELYDQLDVRDFNADDFNDIIEEDSESEDEE